MSNAIARPLFGLNTAQLSALVLAGNADALAEKAIRDANREKKLAEGKLSYTRALNGGIAHKHPSHEKVMAAKAAKAVAKANAASQPPVAKAAKVAKPEPVLTRTVTTVTPRLTIKAVNAKVDALAAVVATNSEMLARIASKLGA